MLSEGQSRILAESKENIEVYDSTGQLVSFVKWFEPMDVEAIARHLQQRGLPKEPTIPSAQVQAHFRRLEEIRQHEELVSPRCWNSSGGCEPGRKYESVHGRMGNSSRCYPEQVPPQSIPW